MIDFHAQVKRWSCCASLGVPYQSGCVTRHHGWLSARPEGWTEAALREMVARVREAGFQEVIPWTDYAPGLIHEIGNEAQSTSVADAKDVFLDRIGRFVEAAHRAGLKVQLYFAIGTGIMASARVHDDGAKRLHVNELGVKYPQYSTRDRSGRSSLALAKRGETDLAYASLAYPDVRSWLADYVVGTAASSGADGIQLEPTGGAPLDEKGVRLHGYDDPTMEAFKQRYGRDPMSLPNDEEAWVNARCEETTKLVREVRSRVASLNRHLDLTIQCHNLSRDPKTFFWPWRDWVAEGLIDACYLKSTSNKGFQEVLSEAKTWCEQRGVRISGLLDTKTYSSFRTPEDIAQGVRTVLRAGITHVTIYGLAFTPLAPNPKEIPVEHWLAARNMIV